MATDITSSFNGEFRTGILTGNRSNSIATILLGCIIIAATIVGILLSFLFDKAVFEAPGLINTFSVVLFFGFCLFALASTRMYFFLLPFVFIAFPAAVNDFMPSVYIGSPDELGAAPFPLITHIDLFLLLGLIKWSFNNKVMVRSNALLTLIILFFLLSFVTNISFTDLNKNLILISGLFPIRYILLILILLSNYDIREYEKPIIYGLVSSVFFLLLESLINTRVSGTEQLTSGTLGANTFANTVTGLLLFFVFLKSSKFRISLTILVPLVVSCCVIIILTETRIAVVAGLLSYLFVKSKRYKPITSFLIVCFLTGSFLLIYNLVDVPERYSFQSVASRIHFNYFSWNPLEMFSIDLATETRTIHTRFLLFGSAINMFFENFFFGIGYGAFNLEKGDYGFNIRVLIDAHNGYLNTLAQMGIFSIPFLYFAYFYPYTLYKRIREHSYLKLLFIINITLAIADLSNAGIYKYSVFALLAFNSIVLMTLSRTSRGHGSESQAH